MTTSDAISDEDLEEIAKRAEAATPGPWFVRHLDDTHAMNLVAVSNVPDTGRHERWPDFHHGEILAATLIQETRYVDIADDAWDENASFIAHARMDVPSTRRRDQEIAWHCGPGSLSRQ